MTSFKARSEDNIHYMQHVLRTDLPYQTEQGNAFSASDVWEIAGGAVVYLEFRIPVGVIVRVYDRITSTGGGDFAFDLCSVTSITPGSTEFSHTNMKVSESLPESRIWRGGSNPVGLVVSEKTFFPAEQGGNSSGSISEVQAYRILMNGGTPPILRITNMDQNSQRFGITVLFTERSDE